MFVHGDRLEGRVDGDEDSDDMAPVGRRNRLTASLSAFRDLRKGGVGHLVCQTEVRGDCRALVQECEQRILAKFSHQ